MKHYKNPDRTESLKRIVPDLYNYQTVLYIGARDDRFDYGVDFYKAGYEITVLEIWPPNCLVLEKSSIVKKVITCDVMAYATDKKYDVVFWWHGPEHIKENQIPYAIGRLEMITKKLCVLGCPWGEYWLGELDGNPYEKHISAIQPELFETYGYNVECLGIEGDGSNITAVKRMGK